MTFLMIFGLVLSPNITEKKINKMDQKVRYFKKLETIQKTDNLFLKNNIIYDKVPLRTLKIKQKSI